MTVRAEIGFEKDRRVVRVIVGDTTVTVHLDAETGVVEHAYGGYGIEVSGPWHKFRAMPPPRFHYTMPETQAVRLLQVDIEERDAEIERLQKRLNDYENGWGEPATINALRADNERLRALLSHWYEMWNDGIPNPDGDVLYDTGAALAGEEPKA